MKAVRFHKAGGPEVLVYEDVPDPTPKDGEVLIRVEAVLPLSQAAEAHRLLEGRQTMGKVVLQPWVNA